MIRLKIYAPAWGQPSASPFCVKAIYLLNMSGLAWDVDYVHDPRPYPKGKLPAIEVNGQIIGDSDGIRAYLAEQGADVDAHLSDQDRADALAYRRLSEEHLYYHLMLDRWGSDAVWPELKRAYFATMPLIVRDVLPWMLRRTNMKGLDFMGHGRADEAERLTQIELDLQALALRLSERDFLFGEQPCSCDASVAAMLGALAASPIATRLSARVADDTVLMEYVARMKDRHS